MTDPSSEQWGTSGTASAEMSVPNTSMVAICSSNVVPNNSVCLTASQIDGFRNSFTKGILAGSISEEKLSDQLIQVALYQQFEAPPSSQNGDLTAARTAFDDIDFSGSGVIPFRHIVRLLKAEDGALALMADPMATLDFSAFVQFVEAAAQQRRA
mmetsp:Transcript_66625/g.77320  ORF Transcript_66625/g.77320 Transcript_66625/m.77320 type:complete len:155 (+) Transcript_66625:80-544(+)|eukprot:CAMPEP_0176411378 /NCGR_PEP_ID=MMETSP0127-20121128/3574_1 /TAXON_ID=938130 /ORGANISM="Platyophrya macrostoma, Strain WH" /LENGTH=154 /DNA_ID=CAMNT_0017790969 /DNA_START=49 /DNA_END=513 /DNA_ORIENTATION=-